MGYCIVHNPLLLQPLRHWFTFISRKYEHLAVEDFVVKVLYDSRGSRRFTFALLPSLCLYYSTLDWVCQGVSANFLSILLHFLLATLQTFWGTRLEVCYFPLTPIVYHRPHQKSSTFSKKIFELAPANPAPGQRVGCPTLLFYLVAMLSILFNLAPKW